MNKSGIFQVTHREEKRNVLPLLKMSDDSNMKCEDVVKIKHVKDKDDTEIDVQTPTEYTEKKWGKTNSGEFIIDGFTFKGKKMMEKSNL